MREALTVSAAEETKPKSFINSIDRTWTIVSREWEATQAWNSPSNFVSNNGP